MPYTFCANARHAAAVTKDYWPDDREVDWVGLQKVLALGTLPLKTLSCDGRLFNFAMANLGGLADGSNVGFIDYRRAGAANRLAGHVPFHLADTLHRIDPSIALIILASGIHRSLCHAVEQCGRTKYRPARTSLSKAAHPLGRRSVIGNR